jgi:dTDP-4-dehydrorhamnose 3,5-epimerase-like enzyme
MRLGAYKIPRRVEFVDVLPKSGLCKMLWRELQDGENAVMVTSIKLTNGIHRHRAPWKCVKVTGGAVYGAACEVQRELNHGEK